MTSILSRHSGVGNTLKPSIESFDSPISSGPSERAKRESKESSVEEVNE